MDLTNPDIASINLWIDNNLVLSPEHEINANEICENNNFPFRYFCTRVSNKFRITSKKVKKKNIFIGIKLFSSLSSNQQKHIGAEGCIGVEHNVDKDTLIDDLCCSSVPESNVDEVSLNKESNAPAEISDDNGLNVELEELSHNPDKAVTFTMKYEL